MSEVDVSTDEDTGDTVTDSISLNEMSGEVHGLFFREGWSFGEYEYPSESDIKDIIERCVLHLGSQNPGTMIEVANLAIRKQENNKYEIYLKLGRFDG